MYLPGEGGVCGAGNTENHQGDRVGLVEEFQAEQQQKTLPVPVNNDFEKTF